MVLHRLSLAHRRQLCRVLFLTCGLLPTLAVAAWATWRVSWRGPSHYARQLSRLVGADVTLQEVVPLRPGAYQVRGVTLRDSETRQTIGTCKSVQVVHGSGGYAVQISQLQIVRAQIVPCWRRLHRVLVDRNPQSSDVYVSLDDLRIAATPLRYVQQNAMGSDAVGTEPSRLDGQLHFTQQADGPELRATLIWNHDDASDACHVRVLRHRGRPQPETRVALTTGKTPLRCDLLPGRVGWANQLGAHATFRGAVWMQNELSADDNPGGGWRGEITGVLGAVDLESLSEAHLSHPLTGTAELTINSCRFQDSHMLELDALVTAGPGLVSQSLLDAMARELGTVLRDSGAGAPTISAGEGGTMAARPYQQLSVQLQLLPQGVALRGRCPDQRPGTLVCDATGALLSESAIQPHSVAALLTALAPRGAETAPVNRTAQQLMQWLPLPTR